MPCYYPIQAWQSNEGGKLMFEPPNRGRKAKGFDDFFRSGYRELKVPCGRCIGCRLNRQNGWALRAMCEAQLHASNWFVTLTYDDEHIPTHGALVYDHVQRMNRRLRKWGFKFRFFVAGEYGDKFQRCHWHALMFGLDLPDLEIVKVVKGQSIYKSATLEKAWGRGFVHIGQVTLQSARYVASYTVKKVTGERAADHYSRVIPETGEIIELPPEMARMSRRPGLASEWLTRYWQEVVTHDSVVSDGRGHPVPRYFDKRLKSMFENDDNGRLILATLKEKRDERAERSAADSTLERLAVREQCAIAKIKFRSDRFGL